MSFWQHNVAQKMSRRGTGYPGEEAVVPRILALHGAGSNSAVTRMQATNLNLDGKYEIVYMDGPLKVNEPFFMEDDPSLHALISGPYYSWLDMALPAERRRKAILATMRRVLEVLLREGPFDGVYGFSQGAVVVAALAQDDVLEILLDETASDEADRGIAAFSGIVGQAMSRAASVWKPQGAGGIPMHAVNQGPGGRSTMRRTAVSKKQSLLPSWRKAAAKMARNQSVFMPPRTRTFFAEAQQFVEDGGALFSFGIFVCGHGHLLEQLREDLGLERTPGVVDCRRVTTVHIIGLRDALKDSSEALAAQFDPSKRLVLYVPHAHEVPRELRKHDRLHTRLEAFLHSDVYEELASDLPFANISPMARSAKAPHQQLVYTTLDSRMPTYTPTLRDMLNAHPAADVAIYEVGNARGITYGELSAFVNTDGALHTIGVMPKEVVVYAAPPGGHVAAAVAFLAFASQTCAAPLDSVGTTEADATSAFAQFNAKHVIIFDDFPAEGIRAAANAAEGRGELRLHVVKLQGPDHPGFFRFQPSSIVPSKHQLVSRVDDYVLLLRTSGTTSKPKAVPLKQGQLVRNGAALGSSIQLTSKDVCLNAMPLFHIGGLSASILATLSVGASVKCLAKFSPADFVEALSATPQPTWYSAVPTIHNAVVVYIRDNNLLVDNRFRNHSLRFIRSGAAALTVPDANALSSTYGGVPILSTYSMSEQMPISQPPSGMGLMQLHEKPGSVGVPVATHLSIVDEHMTPQPNDVEGQVAICGPTVMTEYLDNPEANRANFFLLSNEHIYNNAPQVGHPFFLTGDTGLLDADGHLSLKGRSKELIKKGGEQVSPYEVEDVLVSHRWVQLAVVFSVPSTVWGEEVGAAIILSTEGLADMVTLKMLTKEMRGTCAALQLANYKVPSCWKIVTDDELPKTSTRKYIRTNLAEKLNVTSAFQQGGSAAAPRVPPPTFAPALNGVRFILGCQVMFNHFGSGGDPNGWGVVGNYRYYCLHVPAFFMLGGMTMSATMAPPAKDKLSYALSRIGSMHPMYCVSILLLFINFLIFCNPSCFYDEFTWEYNSNTSITSADADRRSQNCYCNDTPSGLGWWGSTILTLVVYLLGLQSWPLFNISWFLGWYHWFSSVYYLLLLLFPYMYQWMYALRGKTTALWGCLALTLVFNYAEVILYVAMPAEMAEGTFSLFYYLFPPFWIPMFGSGIVTAFLYDAYRPNEKHYARLFGHVGDLISCLFLVMTVLQMTNTEDVGPEGYTMDPIKVRMWATINSRIYFPAILLWLVCLGVGEGLTCWVLSNDFLINTLTPNSYGLFIYQQVVGQYYYLITRGRWWSWWSYRKSFFWFSPKPLPVPWYEAIFAMMLVCLFSQLMLTYIEPYVIQSWSYIRNSLFSSVKDSDTMDSLEVIAIAVSNLTGIDDVEEDMTLEEVGLQSIGLPMLITEINNILPECALTVSAIMGAETLGDMADLLDTAREAAETTAWDNSVGTASRMVKSKMN